MRPMLQSEEALLVLLIDDNHGSFPDFLDVADGTNLELGGRGWLGNFFRYDVAELDSSSQDKDEGRSGAWLAPS